MSGKEEVVDEVIHTGDPNAAIIEPVWLFVEYVRKEMSESADLERIHGAIERAYDQYVSSNPDGPEDKATFLQTLVGCDPTVFKLTANYLFTPIKWSKRQMRRFYGIRDNGNGELITINVIEPNKVYGLELCDNEENDPLILHTHEAAETFMQVFQYQAKIEKLMETVSAKEDDTLVVLEVSKRISSLSSLEIVEVDMIF